MDNQFQVRFEMDVTFYSTADRNVCIYSVKFEFALHFLERLGYHVEQAWSKWGWIKVVYRKQRRFGVKYFFLKNFSIALIFLITL